MAKKKRKNKKKKNSFLVSLLKCGLFCLTVLVLAFLTVNYVFRRSIVKNISMQNTLFDGDNIIMDELSYNLGDPKRYDVICFKSYSENDLLIKRVIGLPGEKVQIKDGIIYINDEEKRDVPGLAKPEEAGRAAKGLKLADDEYFVIGDNRAESIDSRYMDVGNVRRKDILGKAVLVYYPFSHFKVIN